MSEEVFSLIPAAVVVPLGEFRALCDAVVSLHQAVSHISGTLLERLDGQDGDPDLEDDDPPEDSDAHEDDDAKEREDEDGASWIERINQEDPPCPHTACPADVRNHEDAEDGNDREEEGR